MELTPAVYQQYEVVIPGTITRVSLDQLFAEVLGISQNLKMKRTVIKSNICDLRTEHWLATVFSDGSELKIHSIFTMYDEIGLESNWTLTYGQRIVENPFYENGKWHSKKCCL